MKKALIYLLISIFILGYIISYDITKCDGQVIMRHFIDYYDSGKETSSDYVYPKIEYVPQANDSDDSIRSEQSDSVTQNNQDRISFENEQDRGYEYYFSQLEEDEKEVYRCMYEAYINVETGNTIPTVSKEKMNRVAGFIKMDHPELFYVEEMGYTNYTMGGQVQKTVIAARYSNAKAVIKMEQESIDRVVDELIASFPADADDYTKVKLTYKWVIDNTEYNSAAEDNQTIKSVFFSHQSVCAGYSRAMQYILNKAGVPTTIVDGVSLITGETHAWNLCLVNGNYYYLDATWGDASYQNKGYGDNLNGINYDYMLITTEELLRTHLMSDDLVLPLCLATADNYYVREGLFLEYYDYDRIAELFAKAYESGEDSIAFKFANIEIYDEARKNLITNGKVFDFLKGDYSTISYVEDEQQRTICFWL